ncbi:Transcription initiation factor TFIIE subunit alpha [Pleurostoma richardsiae]|uniref:Transcription initiation factor TFIIE subunit alpha n=1 Tax=Pleurostoma richardsiae TaxID=41990 RepID=A0AA38RXE6_9PEZI|nr:Transcription initiation factor TFIIE subunit alpha [Pleurostoma richardsiae]
MSTRTSPSPTQGPTPQADEADLPKGNCRYILLLPEVKGQRCACVNFTHNQAIPGATCDCGHLACFHTKTAEPAAAVDRQEVEALRQRLQFLEDHYARGQEDSLGKVVARVSDLEGLVETRTDEISQEIKRTYGNLKLAWNSIGELERRSHHADYRFRYIDEKLASIGAELDRLHHRQLELNDADINLEERIVELADSIEEVDEIPEPRGRPARRKSTSDSTPPPNRPAARQRPSSASTPHSQGSSLAVATTGAPVTSVRQTLMPLRAAPMSSAETWTVHISLLPTSSQPFPFERNTNAYKRCLSRGLHQMVAINGSSSEAFVSAVSRAFQSLLRGRPWMPLQAKLCDAEQLQGLPMLRPLDQTLVDCKYDADFLRRHCAVLDMSGKIDSLYIAMRYDTLSWHALRHSPSFLDGLEASWEYDPLLDPNSPFEDDDVDEYDRPSAGDLLPPIPSLKRAASEISRSSSFGSAVPPEGEGSRAKAARTVCPMPNIAEVRRRVETV